MALNWTQMAEEMVEGAAASITQTLADHSDTEFVAAALHKPYTDRVGVIEIGGLALLSKDEQEDLGEDVWLAIEWENQVDHWMPEDRWEHWESQLSDEDVTTLHVNWESPTYDHLMDVMVDVAKRSRQRLEDNGTTGPDFVIVVMASDDDYQVATACLRPGEGTRWFPYEAAIYDRLAQIKELPVLDRVEQYCTILKRDDARFLEDAAHGLVDAEEDAIGALVPLLGDKRTRWTAAKLLADIAIPAPTVIEGLTQTLATTKRDPAGSAWVGRALVRLGRTDIVLASNLPADDITSAVTAPYTSFVNEARTKTPLDYGLLTEVLDTHPEWATAIADELRPGSGYRTISPEDIPEAIRGMASAYPVIRWHAVSVIDRSQQGQAADAALDTIVSLVRDDPDPTVRRLALLSLNDWYHLRLYVHTDTVRAATDDPDTAVRGTATYILQSL
ncbi:MAG: hypothetical protein FWF02_03785 [Micrococcales bacterium]|nr:hypothetical protein [Micrococcales bacterium]MCL2666810.1 hypothetical protein [Micrococcales bacterium]